MEEIQIIIFNKFYLMEVLQFGLEVVLGFIVLGIVKFWRGSDFSNIYVGNIRKLIFKKIRLFEE